VGALGAGKEVTIGLVGEAVYLAKEAIAKTVHGVGFPPLPELIDKVLKANVTVFV
jgi:predicted peroxiredoxin